MTFLRHPYLIFPLILLLGLFAFDRIFLIPSIKTQLISWKKVEPPLYESREDLFEQLVEKHNDYRKEDRSIALILGSSRSAEFSSSTFETLLGKKLAVYNFSAPLAPPSFYAYYLEKTLDHQIAPEFVIIEADPLVFTDRSIRYSLSYSYSPEFVLSNLDFFRDVPGDVWDYRGGFSFQEAETYFLKQMFALYKYPLDPDVIQENNKSILLPHPEKGLVRMTNAQFRDQMVQDIETINTKALGGIPNLLQFRNPLINLEKDATNTFQRMGLDSYRISPTQVHFFVSMLETLAEKKIPVYVYWPVASKPLYTKMVESGFTDPGNPGSFYSQLKRKIHQIEWKNPGSKIRLLDYQNKNNLTCRNFADSFHLAGACFHQLSELMVQDMVEKKEQAELFEWDRFTFEYIDSSVPPPHHRSYTINVNTEQNTFSYAIDSYGQIIEEKERNLSVQEQSSIRQILQRFSLHTCKKIQKNNGCTGGTGRRITFYQNDRAVWSKGVLLCGGEAFGELCGDIGGLTSYMLGMTRGESLTGN